METHPKPEPDFLDILSGRYALRSVLGRGAFGTTYLGEDLRLQIPVAVKVVSDSRAETAALFRSEVQLSRKLDHPGIVRTIEAGTADDGRLYAVSEWVEGTNLAAILDMRGPLGTSTSIAVAIAVAEALEYVHKLGILHRDLKPSNILIPGGPSVPDFEHPRILDFGVAGHLDDRDQTRAGMVFGTPRYMSPEQITGQPQTPVTDVYGLGLMLFEMLTGKPPLSRVTDSFSLFKAILEGIPDQELEGIPPDLANLIRRCVQKDPEQRPSIQTVLCELRKVSFRQTGAFRVPAPAGGATTSTGEFPKMFGSQSDSKSSPTSAAGSAEPVKPPALLPSRPPMPASRSAAASRRGTRWMLRITVALALLLGAISFVIWRNSPAAPASQINPPAPAETGSTRTLAVLEFALGMVVMAGSIAGGIWLRGWLGSRSQAKTQALDLALGAKARVDLTATIAVQLDELLGRLRALDERILAGTVALMLDEYGRAADTKDRQAALMNVVALSEKLAVRLSPWYERHKEIIASAVAVLGGVSGLLTAINSILGSHHH